MFPNRSLLVALATIASLCASLAVSSASADSLDAVFAASEQKLKLAQASQERIDKIVEQSQTIHSQWQAVTKEIDGLEVYNTLLDRQIANQMEQMSDLSNSIDQVTVIERQITPLMLRMVDGLDQFIALDVPFLEEERTGRVERLRALLERSDVTVAEKFRSVMEAYQIENDYGRTIEGYHQMLDVGGAEREVDVLRVGRAGLYYQSVDGQYTGVWDKNTKAWTELSDGASRNQIRQGLRIAKKQVAPELMLLPIDAPESAQ
jgi:flagellar biosynthesis/type III secretory pathway chaperone